MKYVVVPADIQLMMSGEEWKDTDGNAVPPWSMSQYLENIVLADPSIGTTYEALKRCNQVSEQFEKAKPEDTVGVEDAHWVMLKATIENPKGGGVPATVLRQLLPFMEAVLLASDKAPSD